MTTAMQYARYKAEKRCGTCGKPRWQGHSTCERCTKAERARKRRRYLATLSPIRQAYLLQQRAIKLGGWQPIIVAEEDVHA